MKILLILFPMFILIVCSDQNDLFDVRCDQLCDRIVCEEVECEDQKKVEKASSCGCCDICEKYSDKNTKCWEDRKWRQTLMEENTLSPESWLPSCNGNYKVKQCKTHKCFCYEENGEHIFGQAEKHLAENMTCGCSLELFHEQKNSGLKWNTEPHEHCSLNGNYADLQCVGDICYCSDPITGKHIGLVTQIKYMPLLPCYDKKKHGTSYLTECEKIVQQTRALVYQFSLKGIELIGFNNINCDYDGSFAKVLCETDRCHCTDRKGSTFKSYRTDKPDLMSKMLCNCARDEYDIEFHHAQYSLLQCTETGNYKFHQIIENSTFCVDEDGELLQYINDKDLDKICLNTYNEVSNINNDDDYDGDDDYP